MHNAAQTPPNTAVLGFSAAIESPIEGNNISVNNDNYASNDGAKTNLLNTI